MSIRSHSKQVVKKTTSEGALHPGFVLKSEIDTARKTMNAVSVAIGVPMTRIHAICNGKRNITADTSARLGLFFGLDPEHFYRLQMDYDMRLVDMDAIAREVRPSTELVNA